MTKNILGKSILLVLSSWYVLSALKTPDLSHFIDWANLAIHEAGHALFAFFPTVIAVLGGSLVQILVPIVFVLYFFFRRELFSSALLLLWLGYSIVNVGVYAGDAFARQLPLLGGDGSIHDWMYLSAHLGLGKNVLVLASTLKTGGVLIVFGGIAWAVFLLWRDYSNTRAV